MSGWLAGGWLPAPGGGRAEPRPGHPPHEAAAPARQDLRGEQKSVTVVTHQEAEIPGLLTPQIEANLKQIVLFCLTLTFPLSDLEIIPPCIQLPLEA